MTVSSLSTSRMTNSVLLLPVGPETIEVKGCERKGNLMMTMIGDAVDLIVAR